LDLQTLKQPTTLITDSENILDMLIEFTIMRKSNFKQLGRYELRDACGVRSCDVSFTVNERRQNDVDVDASWVAS